MINQKWATYKEQTLNKRKKTLKTEAPANDNSIYPGEFNGYPDYSNIKIPTLRAWNRLNTVFNMKEILRNNAMAVKYVAQFPRADQIAIALLAMKVTKNGYENVRREVMRSNNG